MSANTSSVETMLLPMSVTKAGSGSPTLYLHDVLFDLPSGSPPFLDLLAASTAISAPTLPGFRNVAELAAVEDVEDYVFVLLDVVSALALERPHLVGSGLGGWLAAELAVRRPDLFRSLTLINAFGLYVEGHPTARFFDTAAPDPLGGKKAMRHLLFADPEGPLALEVLPDVLDDSAATEFYTNIHAAARLGWHPPAFYNRRLIARLPRITIPTQVVWGRANALVGIEHGEAYADGIPNAQLTVLEGAGHSITMEKPKELAEVVTTFIEVHDH